MDFNHGVNSGDGNSMYEIADMYAQMSLRNMRTNPDEIRQNIKDGLDTGSTKFSEEVEILGSLFFQLKTKGNFTVDQIEPLINNKITELGESRDYVDYYTEFDGNEEDVKTHAPFYNNIVQKLKNQPSFDKMTKVMALSDIFNTYASPTAQKAVRVRLDELLKEGRDFIKSNIQNDISRDSFVQIMRTNDSIPNIINKIKASSIALNKEVEAKYITWAREFAEQKLKNLINTADEIKNNYDIVKDQPVIVEYAVIYKTIQKPLFSLINFILNMGKEAGILSHDGILRSVLNSSPLLPEPGQAPIDGLPTTNQPYVRKPDDDDDDEGEEEDDPFIDNDDDEGELGRGEEKGADGDGAERGADGGGAEEEDDEDEGYTFKTITKKAQKHFFNIVKVYERDVIGSNLEHDQEVKNDRLNEKLMEEYYSYRDSDGEMIAKETKKYFSTDRGYNIDPFLTDLKTKRDIKEPTEKAKEATEKARSDEELANDVARKLQLRKENEKLADERPVIIRHEGEHYSDKKGVHPFKPITKDSLNRIFESSKGFLTRTEPNQTYGPKSISRLLSNELIEQFEQYYDVKNMIENKTTKYFSTEKGYNIDPFLTDLRAKQTIKEPIEKVESDARHAANVASIKAYGEKEKSETKKAIDDEWANATPDEKAAIIAESESIVSKEPIKIRKQVAIDDPQKFIIITKTTLGELFEDVKEHELNIKKIPMLGPIAKDYTMNKVLIQTYDNYQDVNKLIEKQITGYFKTNRGYNIDPFLADLKAKIPILKGKGKKTLTHNKALIDFLKIYPMKRFL